jgi:Tfp pilus assembly protein PilP
MNPQKVWILLIFSMVLAVAPTLLRAQQSDPPAGDETESAEQAPITGGAVYDPIRSPDSKLRDPFKSPFELEQEEQERRSRENTLVDRGEVEEYDIGELDLRGIYLDSRTGYWGIFKIGDNYEWFQVGVKFRDGDLINITDSAVIFKNYTSEDATQVREVVKELHRGEE